MSLPWFENRLFAKQKDEHSSLQLWQVKFAFCGSDNALNNDLKRFAELDTKLLITQLSAMTVRLFALQKGDLIHDRQACKI